MNEKLFYFYFLHFFLKNNAIKRAYSTEYNMSKVKKVKFLHSINSIQLHIERLFITLTLIFDISSFFLPHFILFCLADVFLYLLHKKDSQLMKVRKNGKNQLRKKNNHYERVATRNRIWREV